MQRIFVGFLAYLVTGCAAPPPQLPRVTLGAVQNQNAVLVQLTPTAGLRTQAAAKTLGDIDHYVVKLYNTSGPTLVYTHTTPNNSNTAFYFNNVPDGTYSITAEAFDGGNASLTQGGAQTSANTVTVLGAATTYSNAGSALTVALALFNQTSAQLDSSLSVTPGSNAPAITVTPH